MIDNSIGNQLNNLCIGIYSENKLQRKNARAQLLKETQGFSAIPALDENTLAKYPYWKTVKEYVVNYFLQKAFPFQIDPKKTGVIRAKRLNTERFKTTATSQFKVRLVPNDSTNQPRYVAMIPHHPKLDSENPYSHIVQQIRLLQNEGFLADEVQSREQARHRLRVVVGINYCDDLNSDLNRKYKIYIANFPREDCSDHCAFNWEPQWLDNLKHSQVKRICKLFFAINPTLATQLCAEGMKGKSKVVPMPRVREELKNSDPVYSFIIDLRTGNNKLPCYLLMADDDAKRLRTETYGLFTHYDKLIADNPALEVATTGYFMSDPSDEYIGVGSGLDLIGRRTLSDFFSNAVYYPEPNIIIKVGYETKLSLQKISFIRKKASETSKGLESVGLLERLNLMKGNVNGKVVFGKHGPIQTGISPKLKVKPTMPTKFTAENLKDGEILKSLRIFFQSSINPAKGFAENLCRTLPERFGKRVISRKISYLFTAFDPIEYSYTFPNWLDVYARIVPKMKEIIDNLLKDPNYDPDFERQTDNLMRALGLPHGDRENLKQFLKTKCNNIRELLAALDAENLNLDITTSSKITLASFTLGQAIFNYLNRLITEKLQQR